MIGACCKHGKSFIRSPFTVELLPSRQYLKLPDARVSYGRNDCFFAELSGGQQKLCFWVSPKQSKKAWRLCVKVPGLGWKWCVDEAVETRDRSVWPKLRSCVLTHLKGGGAPLHPLVRPKVSARKLLKLTDIWTGTFHVTYQLYLR